MNNDFEIINESALEALGQNEFYQAQTLFRQNAKQNPCFATFNNLGVFYIFEGLFKPDNSCRSAKKSGVYYLKKAEKLQKSNLTLLALGYVLFEDEDYEEASMNFKQASELKFDYESVYNLALSLYRQGIYKDAVEWFEKALAICDNSNRIETYMAYTFSLLKIDREKCSKELNNLLENDTAYIELEKFTLAYLCNDLQAAERQIKPMLEHFSIDIEEMAMVFECLFRLNKGDEAAEYLKNKVEQLKESSYNFQSKIKRLKKVFVQEEYRKEIISSYRYIAPLFKQCCYYGCKQHNPL